MYVYVIYLFYEWLIHTFLPREQIILTFTCYPLHFTYILIWFVHVISDGGPVYLSSSFVNKFIGCRPTSSYRLLFFVIFLKYPKSEWFMESPIASFLSFTGLNKPEKKKLSLPLFHYHPPVEELLD